MNNNDNYKVEFVESNIIDKDKVQPYMLMNLLSTKINKIFESALPNDFVNIVWLLNNNKTRMKNGILVYRNKGLYCIVYKEQKKYDEFYNNVVVGGSRVMW